MQQAVRDRLLSSTALISLSFLTFAASSVRAQPAALTSPPNDTAPAQEVVVTGSRIRSPSLTSSSPLTVVGKQEITNIGAVGVEQVLNQLPSVVVGQNAGVSGLSNGTATVNLRDLGSSRTLVLVNGKRLMPGDPSSPVADLNVIPSALVDRVEVVTGGASAVYGSDAVAGVVNFILKKNFQGVHLEVTENAAEHDNGNAYDRSLLAASGFGQAPSGNQFYQQGVNVSGLLGLNAPDEKGNITFYGTYRHLNPILWSKYDYSACTISAAPGRSQDSTIYSGHACGGSSNGLYGKFVPTQTSQAVGGTTTQLHANPNGSQSFVNTPVPSYNYGATNYFQRSETLYTAGFNGHYDYNKALSVYSEFMFSDDSTVGQIAPSGLFAGTGANGASTYNINCNNPLLTAAQQGQLCGTAAGTSLQLPYQIGYRFGSFPRDYGFNHTEYKIDVGIRGDLGAGWNYDAYLQYGTSILSNLLVNDTSTTKIQNALLVDPTTGKCLSGGACVPLNVFKLNGVSQAAFNYVAVPALETGNTIEQVASASITGDLGQYGATSPFAHDGVGVAFGGEYRRESLRFTPDNEYQTADLSGTSPAQPNQGSFDVYEAYGEVRAPIVQDKFLVKDLTFDGGYRFSHYSSAGNTNAYKFQLEYAPTSDIRFRGGYNRAVRAPNVTELFTPQTVGLFGGTDPCVGSKPSASQAACVATGLPAALYGKFSNDNACPAGQCGTLTGGNPSLKAEKADTYTGGFVLTPTMPWARGFSLSVDYFRIKITDVITVVPPTVFVSECASGDIAVCSSTFKRDPSTYILYGQQGYVISTETNSGFLSTDGIDFAVNYNRRLSDLGLPDLGVVSFELNTTYTHSFIDQPATGGLDYNCAGLYGTTCGYPLPKLKSKFRATYTPSFAPVSISAAWRYVGPVHLDGNTDQTLLTSHPYGVTDTADNSIHPQNYFDLTATWRIRKNLVLTAGCNNVLDRDPPIVDAGPFAGSGQAAGNGNTYPGVYDYLGRTLFATLAADF